MGVYHFRTSIFFLPGPTYHNDDNNSYTSPVPGLSVHLAHLKLVDSYCPGFPTIHTIKQPL